VAPRVFGERRERERPEQVAGEVADARVRERRGDDAERVEIRPRRERDDDRVVPVPVSALDEQVDAEDERERDERSPGHAEEEPGPEPGAPVAAGPVEQPDGDGGRDERGGHGDAQRERQVGHTRWCGPTVQEGSGARPAPLAVPIPTWLGLWLIPLRFLPEFAFDSVEGDRGTGGSGWSRGNGTDRVSIVGVRRANAPVRNVETAKQ